MDLNYIRELKHKKPKAQKELYERYAEQIFVLILRYVNDVDESKSLVNNTFFKVYQNVETFIYQDEKGLLAWIKKIAVNESLMYLRSKLKLVFIDTIMDNQNTTSETPESIFAVNDYLKMITDLPVGYRTVFNMFAIEGFSHAEIASELNITESTSRSQLTRAREILKKKIEDNF